MNLIGPFFIKCKALLIEEKKKKKWIAYLIICLRLFQPTYVKWYFHNEMGISHALVAWGVHLLGKVTKPEV